MTQLTDHHQYQLSECEKVLHLNSKTRGIARQGNGWVNAKGEGVEEEAEVDREEGQREEEEE